jgi:4-carboxymuconolactone decarboxylase
MNEHAQARVEKLFGGSPLEKTDPEFAALIGNFSQDEVVSAGSLTERERMLCILAALLGVQGLQVFKGMVGGALAAGVDAVSIKEVVYQATAYLGIGRTYDYLQAVNAVLEEKGIALPLEGQSTVTAETRFDKGLAKQVELFGPGMADRQKDCPPLRQNVTRWLADNCFGDYYTRGGLNNQEREMITFCFILAQGGCENQLRGHTAANVGVGNGKERLYQFVDQCMPYIGYPRTLNALAIVDEIAK